MLSRVLVLIGAGVLATTSVQTSQEAGALLKGARAAIGGESKLATVRSLAFQGHTRTLVGSTGKLSDPQVLDIRILLPDNYLRVENHDWYETRSGFAASELLNSAKAIAPGSTFGASYGPEQITIERVTFVRLMLGMLAQTTTIIPLTLRHASAATAELGGPDGFSAFLDFDAKTRLPARLRYTGPVHFPQPGSTMPPAPQQAEIVWTFDDRRDVSGLKLPHRITRTSRDVTLEEMVFKTVRVNPPLSPNDFKK
jgi:hypothetical protein